MKPLSFSLSWAFAFIVLAGCASTTVTSREEYTGPKVARPDRIIVRDFAPSAAEVASDTPMEPRVLPSKPMTAQQIEVGRKLGAELAKQLVADIRAMGLPAVSAQGQPPPRVGDLVLTGYFALIQEGSEAERMGLGFGQGSAKLETHVEGYLMTQQGLQRAGRGNVESGSGEMPGVAAPLAVAALTANPVGLVVGGGAAMYRYETGEDTIEAAAKRTADEIAAKIRPKFEQQGWIQASK